MTQTLSYSSLDDFQGKDFSLAAGSILSLPLRLNSKKSSNLGRSQTQSLDSTISLTNVTEVLLPQQRSE